jgi:hypothetical protein
MTISDELMTAILAYDSYNRGVDLQILGVPGTSWEFQGHVPYLPTDDTGIAL